MRKFLFGLLLMVGCSTTQKSARPDEASAPADAARTGQVKESAVTLKNRAEQVTEELHGVPVENPFRWLENENDPEVKQWMAEQDRHAREALSKVPARDELLKRFRELYYVESMSVPVKQGGRYFYSRTHKGKEKAIVYWRQGLGGAEHVLLDPNTWSSDNTVSLGVWSPSFDGKKVVFAEKPNAADEATLYVLDVDSGKRSVVDVVPGAKYASPQWVPDSKSFIYEWVPVDTSIPVAERPGHCEVRLHTLGQAVSEDAMLHPRTGDPKTFIGGSVSRDGKYFFVSIMRGWNENDLYFKRVGVDTTWKLLVAGKDARYSVTAWKGVFYIFTDEGAPNQRVFKADPARADRKHWTLLIDEDKTAARESLTVAGGHLAISSLKKATSQLELFTLGGKKVRSIDLPGLGTASNLVGNEDDDEAFFSFSSFTMPPRVMRTSVARGGAQVWSEVELPIDPSKFEVRQVSYPSKDGTLISMFIVASKSVRQDGSNPVLLYGYGGFDVSVRSQFNSFIYPWLEAGGVYAVPNLRGGGEYGKVWHDSGKLARKQNVFDDFAGAARYLIDNDWSRPERIGIRGGSNGGLLVGAALTQFPELFGAAICAVPLLDMVRYHLYGSGQTWIPEYGNPDDENDFKTLYAYSPYHRIERTKVYPPLLMMSADHDDRVDPFHARKFVARLQNESATPSNALLRIEMNAGHGGSDQVAKAIESSADQLGFLMGALRVVKSR
jgi:prolyl oligopeptidase